MSFGDYASGIAVVVGAFFYFAGTVGLVRFPDVYTWLHALTKADNLGLGCIVLGLAGQAESWSVVAKLFLVWALVMLASTTCCHLVAHEALEAEIQPWSHTDDE